MTQLMWRPQRLAEFIGQDALKRQLETEIQVSKLRRTPLPHMLFAGAGGLGKTSLAQAVAGERGVPAIYTMGGSLKNQEALSDFMLDKIPADGYDLHGKVVNEAKVTMPVAIIDEAEKVPQGVLELMHTILEPVHASGFPTLMARRKNVTKEVWVAPLTIIFISNYLGELLANSRPTVTRFKLRYIFKAYNEEQIAQIVEQHARRLGLKVTEGAVMLLAKRSCSMPRQAVNLLERAEVSRIKLNKGKIDEKVVEDMLLVQGVNKDGLEPEMVAYLETLARTPSGRMSIQALSGIMSIDEPTLMELIEPVLLKKGLICRTTNGRQITPEGLAMVQIADESDPFRRITA